MQKIMACVDGSAYGQSVCDHAAWAAERLGVPVEVLHARGRRETGSVPADFSGNLEFGDRSMLMSELAEFDEQRAKLATKRGRAVLEQAVARLKEAGVTDVTQKLRDGDISDALTDLAEETRFVIIGKRGEAADFSKGHLGSNLERVVRSSKRPVLIASRAFKPIKRFMVAFDGGRSSPQIVERLVASPLLKDVHCDLFMVGKPSGDAGQRLHEAETRLREAGYAVAVYAEEGDAEECIARKVERDHIDLIVMGAYGHSRIRTLFVGSTTAEIIRGSTIPALIIR